MPLNACPAAFIAAPIDTIWAMLTTPARYGEWWDARVGQIMPEGSLCPSQVITLKSKALGKSWPITFEVETVDAMKHQVPIHVIMPLGMILENYISCVPVDATTTRVQYG